MDIRDAGESTHNRPKTKRTWRSYSVDLGPALVFACRRAPLHWLLVSSFCRTAYISDNTLDPQRHHGDLDVPGISVVLPLQHLFTDIGRISSAPTALD